jgi:hypothetical protein
MAGKKSPIRLRIRGLRLDPQEICVCGFERGSLSVLLKDGLKLTLDYTNVEDLVRDLRRLSQACPPAS